MSAKPQVTITLGRTGQVVKRAGASSEGTHSDYGPLSGAKRPIRERLRNKSDVYGCQFQTKRQRRENHQWSSAGDDMDDRNQFVPYRRIGQNDLRFKLMQKNVRRQMNLDSEMHDVDLRERLSRTTQTPLRFGVRKHQTEPRNSRFFGRIPPTRSADDLLHMDSLRRSYSPGPSERFRHRSPGRLLGTSRGLSPPKGYDDLQQRSSIRSLDPPRLISVMAKAGLDVQRPATFAAKPPYTVESSKPAMRHHPLNGTMKGSYAAGKHSSVSSLLHSLGLGKYAILFQAEEVDMAALKQMGDDDLKELGIPMGPRKKILLALLRHAKQ